LLVFKIPSLQAGIKVIGVLVDLRKSLNQIEKIFASHTSTDISTKNKKINLIGGGKVWNNFCVIDFPLQWFLKADIRFTKALVRDAEYFSIWFKLFFSIMTPITFVPGCRHGTSIISNYIWVCLILSFLTFSCMYENIKKYIIRVSSM